MERHGSATPNRSASSPGKHWYDIYETEHLAGEILWVRQKLSDFSCPSRHDFGHLALHQGGRLQSPLQARRLDSDDLAGRRILLQGHDPQHLHCIYLVQGKRMIRLGFYQLLSVPEVDASRWSIRLHPIEKDQLLCVLEARDEVQQADSCLQEFNRRRQGSLLQLPHYMNSHPFVLHEYPSGE